MNERERNIERLPSGSFRVKIQSSGHSIAETFKSLDLARSYRDDVLRRIDEGTFVHADVILGRDHAVCGLAPVRVWPTIGGVYFCAVPGIPQVKIGWAANVRRRLNELACGAPRLVLLARTNGTRALELELHDRFAAYRMRGEWFALEGEVLAYVRGVAGDKS